jgi:hypothetical protein
MSIRSEVLRILNEVFSNSKKITELPDLPSAVANSDLVEVVRSGVNYKGLGSQLPSGGGSQDLQSVLDEGSQAFGLTTHVIIETSEDWNITAGTITFVSLNGNINVGNCKIVSLAAGTVAGDAVRYEQTQNGFHAVDTTGTAISFAVPQIYGSDGSPETGNITVVTTGLVKGMTQLLIHNNGSTPTFGSPIKIISGAYVTGELNYILLLAVSTTSVLVTISQEV